MCDKPPGFVVVDAVVTVDSVEVSVVDSLVNDSDPEEGALCISRQQCRSHQTIVS